MLTRIVSLLVLSVFFLGLPVVGQAPSPAAEPTPVIHATTREVLLDFVARDKHHRAISDLHPQEVEVYEDGVLQTVKSFRNIEGAEQLQLEREAAQNQAPTTDSGDVQNTAKGASPAPTLNTLKQINFVSVVFAQIAPLDLDFARRAVLEFLKSDTLPNTFVTVYTMNPSLQLVQDFTGDKDLLAKSVDAASKGVYGTGGLGIDASIASAVNAEVHAENENIAAAAIKGIAAEQATNPNQDPSTRDTTDPLWARNSASLDASVSLGNALQTQSDTEKGLRFATSLYHGMDTMDSLRALVHHEEKLPGRKVVLYLSDGLAFPVNRRDVVDGLISYANRSGVSFYTVDTRGLSTDDPMLQPLADMKRAGAESSAQVTDPQSGHMQDDDIQLTAVSNDQQTMQELAEATGGFAVANTNQIEEPMQRMMEDIRTHYELAYTPTSTNYDGHFRKIEVKLARPKIMVQTRSGYYALPELNGEPLQPFEVIALKAINARPAPVEFPYHVAAMEFRPKENAVDYEVAFEVPTSALTVVSDPKTGKARIRASVFAVIHDTHGEIISKVGRDLVREVQSKDVTQLANDRILYAEPVELPAGHYVIDTAVTDEQVGKTTVRRLSVFVDPGSGLGLSSVQLVRGISPLAGPRNPGNPFESDGGRITPTLADSMASGKPVDLYFIVYPAKQAPADQPKVTLQLYRDGKEVARKPLALAKPQADGSIPMMVQLSPDTGQFDIRITAQQGTLVAESTRSLKIE